MRQKTRTPQHLENLVDQSGESRKASAREKRREETAKRAEDRNRERGILVDEEDADLLRTGWWIHKFGYAYGTLGGKTVKLHRLVAGRVFGECPSGMCVDHINGIKTDNRRCNLRYATLSDNSRNRHPVLEGHFIGVIPANKKRAWAAMITPSFNGQSVSVQWHGCKTREQAAFRYNQLAQLFGFRTRNPVGPEVIPW